MQRFDYSAIGDYFLHPATPAVLQSYAEVLFLARRAGYRVREIPFALRQHDETRIDFLADTPRMLRDLFLIRLNALRGAYR
jgi:hypothetical protein